jgi:glycosyltransferase involved in cell wall biosynthesis
MRRFARRFIHWADNASVCDAHALLTDGEYISSQIQSIYGRPNAVCPARCYPLPEASLDYGKRITGSLRLGCVRIPKPFVLLTNRHSPQKRFEYALWGLKMIQKKCPNLSLVIAGQETSYTMQLRYLVDGLGLRTKVYFVGLVSEEHLSNLHSQAALYVYTSPDEDSGMGILEAMAHGTRVVAWNHSGPTSTVENGVTGFLATPDDANDFAEKMARLVTDPELAERMGRAGHNRVVQRFSFEHRNRVLERTLWEAIQAFEPARSLEQLTRADAEAQVASVIQGGRIFVGHDEALH